MRAVEAQALARRTERKPRKVAASAVDAFNLHRQAQSQRARTLGMLLIAVDAGLYDLRCGVRPISSSPAMKAYGASVELAYRFRCANYSA